MPLTYINTPIIYIISRHIYRIDMLGSRNSKSPRSPRTPRTPNSPRTRKSPRAPRSPVFIDMGSGSLDTSPVSPQAAKWATVVRQASPASPQAARRTSPPLPPSYQTTVGVNAPLYSMRSPAAIAAIAKETEYPSKFLAIYYIDMMLGFIEDFAVCCIGMLSGIERARYIMAEPHFKHGTINELIKIRENMNRYKYKQGNIETEVKHIEFFLREKGYTSLATSSYYMGLRYIWSSIGHPKNGIKIAKRQHAHISTIIGNTRYSDEKKLEEIQKYTTKENKELVVMINEKTKLNKMSLVSVDDKLKFITTKINELENIISQNLWTAAGKRKYNEYLEIIRRQKTLGGKRGKAKRGSTAKGCSVGGVGSRLMRFLGIKDKGYRVIPMKEDISQDYMAIVNIYKDAHIDKLRMIYDTIVSIFNYAEYPRKIAREDILKEHQRLINEYGHLLKKVNGFDGRNYRIDEKRILAILESQPSAILESKRPDLSESNEVVRAITHNFYIINGRKVDLERKISMYYA